MNTNTRRRLAGTSISRDTATTTATTTASTGYLHGTTVAVVVTLCTVTFTICVCLSMIVWRGPLRGPVFSSDVGWYLLRQEATARGKILSDAQVMRVCSDFAPFEGFIFTAKDAARARAQIKTKTSKTSVQVGQGGYLCTLIRLGRGVNTCPPPEFKIAHATLKQMNKRVTIAVSHWDEPVSGAVCGSSVALAHSSTAPGGDTDTDNDARASPFFTDPSSYPSTDRAFPYFSNCKTVVPGHNVNIVACLWNNGHFVTRDLKVGTIPPVPWVQKEARVVWRGSTTGGGFSGAYPVEHYPRFRIVDWAKKTPLREKMEVDVALTSYVGLPATGPVLQQVKEGYPLGAYQDVKTQFNAKYLLVIDGNAWPNRTAAFLHAGSVVLLASAFQDWVSRQIEPWVHYVPIRLDFSDLDKKLIWLVEHDAEAQAIGARGKAFAERELDLVSMQLYNAAVVLEYARLFEP